jgi:protein-L-isoaspartate(D-aspartate) O-methyltransferase
VGDALATEMAALGEHNLGQLCRGAFGARAQLIGFGTDHGTVAAATEWDGPVQIMEVHPSHPQSYEHLCHMTNKSGFILPLGREAPRRLRQELMKPRLERAIGVVYRPQSELASHYFEAMIPDQFDSYIWFDETSAVNPLAAQETMVELETYPFGL